VPEMPSICSQDSSSRRSRAPQVKAPCAPPPCNAKSMRTLLRLELAVLLVATGVILFEVETRYVPCGGAMGARPKLGQPDRWWRSRLLIGCQGLNHMTSSLSRLRCEAQQQAGFWPAEIDGRHEIVGDQINLGPGRP